MPDKPIVYCYGCGDTTKKLDVDTHLCKDCFKRIVGSTKGFRS